MHRYSALALSALIALSAAPAMAHPHPQGQPCEPPAGTTSPQPGTTDQGAGAEASTDATGGGGGTTGAPPASGAGADASGTLDGGRAFDDIDKDRPNQSGRQ
ncbi:hypothetical protein D3C72_765230 [compost metagenome]